MINDLEDKAHRFRRSSFRTAVGDNEGGLGIWGGAAQYAWSSLEPITSQNASNQRFPTFIEASV